MLMFQPAGARHIVSRKFAHGVNDVARDCLVGKPLASCRLVPQAFGFSHVGTERPLQVDNPAEGIKVRSAEAAAACTSQRAHSRGRRSEVLQRLCHRRPRRRRRTTTTVASTSAANPSEAIVAVVAARE